MESLSALGRVGVIGAGATGTTLARVLAACGAHVVAVASRSRASAAALAALLPGARALPVEDLPGVADLILLAVSDAAITPLAETLPWRAGQGVTHLSGARGVEALAAVARCGAHPAALHPLMTFARPSPDVSDDALLRRLAGCSWALEADDPALASTLETLVTALGGSVVRLAAADRVPYHISGVLASNYIVSLIAAAVHLWETFASPEDALRSLLPLLRGTADNLTALGMPQALSGPIARGDIETVAAHLDWLRSRAATDPQIATIRDAYIALAELTIPIALANGTLTPEAAEQARALLRHSPA